MSFLLKSVYYSSRIAMMNTYLRSFLVTLTNLDEPPLLTIYCDSFILRLTCIIIAFLLFFVLKFDCSNNNKQ